ncbi:MAG: aminoacyl-tRNA hydrolase [Candidatus Caenarcaniphilales bacterium]|nr:aminoacyl-tRNA hydrolase [Candidatus Caenarcaniphilales bacterium]
MKTKLIVGLGNPGEEYKNTRHNIGFMLLDALAARFNNDEVKSETAKKLKSKVKTISSRHLVLLYPQTFMNLSGEALRAALTWYKITDYKQILVVYDDVALPLGKIRWVTEGGAGGHHGIESIIQQLGGCKDFTRLKFGVGPDPGGDRRSSYVLQKFPASELEKLERCIKTSVESINEFINEKKLQDIMNKYNGLEI